MMPATETAPPLILPCPSDNELLRRAVCTARSRQYARHRKHPRWIAVMDTFVTGSTAARNLCTRFGIDPDEEVTR